MGDVFLLGAGFSRAIASEMPLLGDLNRAVWTKVRLPDEKTFLNSFGGDIELILTYLAQSHPWMSEAENLRNRALFLDLSGAVRDVLVEAMRSAAERPCPQWLTSLINYWDSAHCDVLTLNYDTLVESAARLCDGVCRLGILPSRYYPFTMVPLHSEWDEFAYYVHQEPAFHLFKLHGSINWLYSGSASFSGETVFYGALDDIWNPSRFRKLGITDKTPLIVPPVAEKVGYFQHPHVRGTWREAAAALRTASRVFCLGYSLPELDITMRFFLHRNHPPARVPFFLVDVNDLRDHFTKLLPEHNYIVDSHFVGPDNPIQNFVNHLDDHTFSQSQAVTP
ncbi:MAG: hypothetical protein ABI759_24185 [Candidatus Solibacter sp.]